MGHGTLITYCTVHSKVAMFVDFMNRLKNVPDSAGLSLLYNALILQLLLYANIAWGSGNSHVVNNVHKLQKTAVRAICNAGFTDHTVL